MALATLPTIDLDVDPSPVAAGRCESCRAEERQLYRVTSFRDSARFEVCRACLP